MVQFERYEVTTVGMHSALGAVNPWPLGDSFAHNVYSCTDQMSARWREPQP